MIRLAVWILLASPLWAQSGNVEGTWQGTLHAGAIALRLGLHVTKDASGAFSSKLDSIDQGAMGLPVQVTTFQNGKLHFELPNLHATFDGTLNQDGTEITGTFTQGAPMPLTFRRVEHIETLNRPQDPKPPFPYSAEEVAYETSGGIHLAGTLTVPKGEGPFAAAVMITGSGPEDRDETVFGHRPFLIIADALTRRGIAVLRLDDRGVGKSTGSSSRATLSDMAGDVLAGVAFLRGRKEIDPARIGLIGHSEGGIVGPLAASRDPRVAFVVMLAGTGVTGEQVLSLQAELIARSTGASQQVIAQNHQVQKMLLDALRESKDEKDAIEKMKAAWEKMKAAAPEAERKQMAARDAAMETQYTAITSPELKSFVFYDPAETLRKLKIPVLAMNGARDIQVPPQQNLPAIAAALAAADNQDFTIVELPGLNHLFQHCKDCTVAEYAKIEETFSPSALALLCDWVARHTEFKR